MKILKHRLLFIAILLGLSGCAPSGARKARKSNKFGKGSDELVARVSSIPDTPFFAQIEDFGEDPESMYNLIVRKKNGTLY